MYKLVGTKKLLHMNSTSINSALKETLSGRAELTTVWFNEAGEWSFHAREGYDSEFSRNELLGLPEDINEEEAAQLATAIENKTIDLNEWTVPELKEECKKLGIAFQGNASKQDLIQLLNTSK